MTSSFVIVEGHWEFFVDANFVGQMGPGAGIKLGPGVYNWIESALGSNTNDRTLLAPTYLRSLMVTDKQIRFSLVPLRTLVRGSLTGWIVVRVYRVRPGLWCLVWCARRGSAGPPRMAPPVACCCLARGLTSRDEGRF